MAISSSTISLLRTMEWAKRFTFDRESALGSDLEPAITSANLIMQTILGAPFAWRWNRVVTGFITKQGQQDYTLFNWSATYAINTNFVTVDSHGNCQACTTAGTTGSTIPAYNPTQGNTTTDGSAVWTNMGSISTPVSISYNFAWIETVSLQATDNNDGTLKWKEIKSKICLGLDSAQSRPHDISAQGDDNQGNITFRLMPVPDTNYPVAITLQQKPPVFNPVTLGINQTWAPIPDEYLHIYTWGFLALMFLFADDPRFQSANQKFVANLLSTNQGLTQTQLNIFLNNWQNVTGQPMVNDDKTQQGYQARQSI